MNSDLLHPYEEKDHALGWVLQKQLQSWNYRKSFWNRVPAFSRVNFHPFLEYNFQHHYQQSPLQRKTQQKMFRWDVHRTKRVCLILVINYYLHFWLHCPPGLQSFTHSQCILFSSAVFPKSSLKLFYIYIVPTYLDVLYSAVFSKFTLNHIIVNCQSKTFFTLEFSVTRNQEEIFLG